MLTSELGAHKAGASLLDVLFDSHWRPQCHPFSPPPIQSPAQVADFVHSNNASELEVTIEKDN